MSGIRPFRDFVRELTDIVDGGPDEATLLQRLRPAFSHLIASDGWLPAAFSQPGSERYRQYLLHCDLLERFSIVSFVWGPGQETPVHNHTVWGMLGVLRGSERSQRYELGDGALAAIGAADVLESGETTVVSPTLGDIHSVRNGSATHPSVAIHVYGGNIGRINRHVFLPDGARRSFVSRYSEPVVPNLWLD